MKYEFAYRPPLKFLFQMILGFIGGSMFFAIAIFIPEAWWFKTLMFFFSLMLFGYFLLFYKRCFYNRKGNKLIVSGNSVILPFTQNGINLRFRFSEIKGVEVYDTYYSQIIELQSNKGVLELEKIWMKKKQYAEFLKILKSNIKLNENEFVHILKG